MKITKEYLQNNPNHIFVFGDNKDRDGFSGAAILRNEHNTYGFITKKRKTHNDQDYYKPSEYFSVFRYEYDLLCDEIESNPDKKYLISKFGSGVANKYQIWETIVSVYIDELRKIYKR